MDLSKIAAAVKKSRLEYQRLLAETLPDSPPWQIDEVACAFSNRGTLEEFVESADRELGWGEFNRAVDSVHCEPLSSNYLVEYVFLTPTYIHESNVLFEEGNIRITDEWRIEAMRVGRGYNPLMNHWQYDISQSTHSTHPGMLGWVHASFKLPDEDAYEDCCYTLGRRGWVPVQVCTSNYGAFTYFKLDPDRLEAERRENPALPFLYLKPRVNLRDKR